MKRFFIFMENNRSRTPYKVTIKIKMPNSEFSGVLERKRRKKFRLFRLNNVVA
jgi:hypothetical protein